MTAAYDPRPDWAREDAKLAQEAARPRLETLVVIEHLDHTHASVTEWITCEETRFHANYACTAFGLCPA